MTYRININETVALLIANGVSEKHFGKGFRSQPLCIQRDILKRSCANHDITPCYYAA